MKLLQRVKNFFFPAKKEKLYNIQGLIDFDTIEDSLAYKIINNQISDFKIYSLYDPVFLIKRLYKAKNINTDVTKWKSERIEAKDGELILWSVNKV